MRKIKYRKCSYDPALVDGEYQSSFFFALVDEVQIANENRLYNAAAITLLCAIEMAGRQVMQYEYSKTVSNNSKCFNYFLEHYMDYGTLVKKQPKVYDIFRNGFVHNGGPKFDGGGSWGAGYSDYMLERLGIEENKIRGLNINGEAHLLTDVLLHEFVEGLKKFRKNELDNGWNYNPLATT